MEAVEEKDALHKYVTEYSLFQEYKLGFPLKNKLMSLA